MNGIITCYARRNLIIADTWWLSILLSPWHTPQFMIIASAGDIDIMPWHTPQFMIIAWTWSIDIIIALTHAAVHYRPEPGDIDIII
jgi:hypothetical protein